MSGGFPPLARLMIRAFRAFEAELIRRLHEQGIRDISYSNLNVIRHLDRDGLRLSILARDAGLSKQALGKLVSELENKGYLKIAPDPEDGRAKRVSYTRKGQKLIDTAITIVEDMERGYRKQLGAARYQSLRDALILAQQVFE